MAAERRSATVIVICMALVWVVWGTTYLAIRVAIESLPPLLMAGVRYLLAGTILALFAAARGAARPTWRQLAHTAGLGFLFFFVGNGAVVLAETRITSGVAALLVATEPLFVVLFALRWPSPFEGAGMILSTAGLVLLVGIPQSGGHELGASLLVLVGCAGWALASLRVRTADLPRSAPLASGLEMLAGGIALTLGGLARGETFDPSLATTSSILAFGYLVVFGSIVAFTAYQLLARAVSPPMLATYAYVNPVVAVAAGIVLANEPATATLAVASATIVAGVVLITTAPILRRRRAARVASA